MNKYLDLFGAVGMLTAILLGFVWFNNQDFSNDTYIFNNATCEKGIWSYCGYRLENCNNNKTYLCASPELVKDGKSGFK